MAADVVDPIAALLVSVSTAPLAVPLDDASVAKDVLRPPPLPLKPPTNAAGILIAPEPLV